MSKSLLAFAILLAGCAPKLSLSNEAGGVISQTGSIGNDRSYKMAEDHCGKFGKSARISNTDILTHKTRFDCVSK